MSETQEPRLSGTLAIHNQDIVDLAQAMGEKVYDDDNRYMGLTYPRLEELLVELHNFRTDQTHAVMADTLAARTEELTVLQVRIAGLRRWMNDNTKANIGDDEDPIGPTIKMLSDVKTLIQSCWPVLQTMWGNVTHVLRQVGLM